ncbi:hypothetical protein CGLY_04585 [Corynebacterium glyciniphilum AJ 3170]|uniref:Phosphoribosyltransferase n=1 Tax=Corynebacterium glyciniphilum AJ 3170 TaxID=1404245 RepID=X5E7H0_9CORY|nr:ComF family protein [Corynebacterium glyciniphilum]AHW63365.1 hypothetical protein CGLY_04585 [Corynebacterium glyciniphilum AJ 3170]
MGAFRVGELAGLVWRDDCLACGTADVAPAVVGLSLCRRCAHELRRVPSRVADTWAPPVFAAGTYGGAHRGVVLAAKEQRRTDAVQVAGAVMAGTVRHLVSQGVLADPRLAPLVLLPAPTTRRAAKDRGGCIVERSAEVARRELGGGVHVVAAATLAPGARDSVGLGRGERTANIAANLRIDPTDLQRAVRILRVPGATACLVDDVSTTGATLSRFAAALAARGVVTSAGVVIAQA